MAEVCGAIKHFAVTKAKGIDDLNYFLLRHLVKNRYFAQTLLCFINTIYAVYTYPDRMNVIKFMLLQKVDCPESFADFRGISILQNLKSIVQYMIYRRTKGIFDDAVHPNQSAYRQKHSTSLTVSVLSTAIKAVERENGRVYGAVTDLNKAFDTVHRGGLLLQLHHHGVIGRNIRLIHDDMVSSRAVITYDGIHSREFAIRNGLGQGKVSSGPEFNVSMKPVVVRSLKAAKTWSYGLNVASTTFADDGMKLAKSLRDLQSEECVRIAY